MQHSSCCVPSIPSLDTITHLLAIHFGKKQFSTQCSSALILLYSAFSTIERNDFAFDMQHFISTNSPKWRILYSQDSSKHSFHHTHMSHFSAFPADKTERKMGKTNVMNGKHGSWCNILYKTHRTNPKTERKIHECTVAENFGNV